MMDNFVCVMRKETRNKQTDLVNKNNKTDTKN